MAIQHLNSHICVRAYDKTIDAGYIEDSRKPRQTEIDAIQRMRWGDPYPATDTIGEALRAGKCRCPRCNQYKAPSEYGTYKRKGYDRQYRKTYCHACLADMERTRRFSKVEPLQIYPKRLA